MYRTPTSLWNGLAKNVREGLAAPRMIVPMSAILVAGQLLPIFLFLYALGSATIRDRAWILGLTGLAIAASYYPRTA